jgi:hypothetical protein
MGLTAALQAVRQVYEKERRSTVTLELVAKALGHQSLSGPATSKVAALRQYGLLEAAGSGKYRVSDLAMTLLLTKSGDVEYDQALRRAALTPPLFTELREAHPDASEDALRYHLVKERKFSEEGAARVIKAFRDAVSVAKLDDSSYSGAKADTAGDAQGEENRKRGDSSGDATRQQVRDRAKDAGANSVTYSWPLEDAERLEVVFVGSTGKRPTRRDLEAAIDYLELIKKRTPEARDEELNGSEEPRS